MHEHITIGVLAVGAYPRPASVPIDSRNSSESIPLTVGPGPNDWLSVRRLLGAGMRFQDRQLSDAVLVGNSEARFIHSSLRQSRHEQKRFFMASRRNRRGKDLVDIQDRLLSRTTQELSTIS